MQQLVTEAELLLSQAHAHDRYQRQEQWLRASKQITARLVSRRRLPLTTITETLLGLGVADLICIIVPAENRILRVIAATSSSLPDLAASLRGTEFETTPDTLAGVALRTGHSQQQDAAQLQHPYAVAINRQAALGAYLAVPLSRDNPQGVLTLTRLAGTPNFTADDINLIELLAHQAGLAWQLGRVDSDQQRLNTLEDRDRTSRTRNDETLQRLFALNTTLHNFTNQTNDDDSLSQAVADLDQLIQHLRPTVKPAPTDTTTPGALQAALDAAVAPLSSALDFHPHLEVDMNQPALDHRSAIPTALTAVIASVVYDTTRQAATDSQVNALKIHIYVDDGWLVIDAIEHGTDTIEDWAYPLRADLEDRAGEFDGFCTLTNAGPQRRRLSWRIPLS